MAEIDKLRERVRREAERLKAQQERQRERQAEFRRGRQEERAAAVEETPGRLGIVSPEARAETRRGVEQRGFFGRLGAEAAPATLGTVLGGAAGAPIGAPGILLGGALGGMAGELIGQEAGVAPESDFAVGAAGLAPLLGAGGGAAARGTARASTRRALASPPARSAIARVTERGAAEEFRNVPAQVLAKASRGRGLPDKTADEIFDAARTAGAVVLPARFKRSRGLLADVREELQPLRDFPEGSQALTQVDRLQTALTQGEPISFDNIISIRRSLGNAIRQAERAGGEKLGTAKQLFKSFEQDLEDIAKASTKTGQAARDVKQGFSRAQIELHTTALEEHVEDAIRLVPGRQDVAELNVGQLRETVENLTNPKHKNFDKNFTQVLKDSGQLDGLKSRLSELAEITNVGKSPAGPSALVFRGITALGGGTAGAAIGSLAGTPGLVLGSSLGSLAGAQAPDAILAILLSPRGSKVLKSAVKFGKGEVSHRVLTNALQVALQGTAAGAVRAGQSAGIQAVEAGERALREEPER